MVMKSKENKNVVLIIYLIRPGKISEIMLNMSKEIYKRLFLLFIQNSFFKKIVIEIVGFQGKYPTTESHFEMTPYFSRLSMESYTENSNYTYIHYACNCICGFYNNHIYFLHFPSMKLLHIIHQELFFKTRKIMYPYSSLSLTSMC